MDDKLDNMPQMVKVPAAEFTMGDLWKDGDADETPVYNTWVESFYLSKYAVTNRQFVHYLNDLRQNRDENGNTLIDIHKGFIDYKQGTFFCKQGFETHPVVYVSWHGAVSYCQWLTAKTSQTFRLPTEVEWQYAASGPQHLKWSLEGPFDLKKYIGSKKCPAPVDVGRASDLGLFNMTGNVFEWCHDEYRFSLDQSSDSNILTHNRVIKGGAFILADSMNFRNAKRFSCCQKSCLNCIGFRVAAD
ncbi:MAG: SUMF1/EgtB/PvdO family nonheme iron enzyme [Candidatus Aminicenantes bacterium]|jgi:formylglycine-generating enzyme required for sulfatase activity